MQMMNASLEDVKTQCNSRVFNFRKRETINNVPSELAPMLYEQLKNKGIFIVPENPDDFDKARYNALRLYLKGTLKLRIQNYLLQYDEFKKRGVTLPEEPHYQQALKWQTELSKLLDEKAPVVENLSFDDYEKEKVELEIEAAIDERIQQTKKTDKRKTIKSFEEVEA